MASSIETRLAPVTARDGIDTRKKDLIVAPNDKGELACDWCKKTEGMTKMQYDCNFGCCSDKCYNLAFKRSMRESSKPKVPADDEEEVECMGCHCWDIAAMMYDGLCDMCHRGNKCDSSKCRRCGHWDDMCRC